MSLLLKKVIAYYKERTGTSVLYHISYQPTNNPYQEKGDSDRDYWGSLKGDFPDIVARKLLKHNMM